MLVDDMLVNNSGSTPQTNYGGKVADLRDFLAKLRNGELQ